MAWQDNHTCNNNVYAKLKMTNDGRMQTLYSLRLQQINTAHH